MNIGEMKDRATIKTLQKVSNGRGGWLLNEIEVGTVWAFIEQLRASNIVQFRQADLNSDTKIVLRKEVQINRESVIYARGQKFTIEQILEKGNYYEILAVGENIHGE